MKLKYHLH